MQRCTICDYIEGDRSHVLWQEGNSVSLFNGEMICDQCRVNSVWHEPESVTPTPQPEGELPLLEIVPEYWEDLPFDDIELFNALMTEAQYQIGPRSHKNRPPAAESHSPGVPAPEKFKGTVRPSLWLLEALSKNGGNVENP